MPQPDLGGKFTLDGNQSQLRASCWLSAPREKQDDPKTNEIIEKIRKAILEYNISISVQVSEMSGESARDWPKVGKFYLYPNRPKEGYAAMPQKAHAPYVPPPPSLRQAFEDEIPFD
jgi:hypothetical protein